MPRFRNLIVNTSALADGAVTAAKLAAAAVTSAKIAVSLQSDNYVAGVAGWRIDRVTGSIEAQDITARGTLRTALAGERVEIGTTFLSRIDFYTGHAAEVSPGTILGDAVTVGPSPFGAVTINAPNLGGGGLAAVTINGRTAAGGNSQVDVAADEISLAGDLVTVLNIVDGSAATPGIRFAADHDTGIYRLFDDDLGVTVGGSTAARFTTSGAYIPSNKRLDADGQIRIQDGTSAAPAIAFTLDTDTGITRPSNNAIEIVAGGTRKMLLLADLVDFAGISANTTGNGANVHVTSPNGRLLRSTSSRRYKAALRPWDRRASVLDLEPTLFRSRLAADDGRRLRLGLIAEDVAEVFPLAAVFDSEGRPDAIDWNTITAGILAEVRDLAGRVAALE